MEKGYLLGIELAVIAGIFIILIISDGASLGFREIIFLILFLGVIGGVNGLSILYYDKFSKWKRFGMRIGTIILLMIAMIFILSFLNIEFSDEGLGKLFVYILIFEVAFSGSNKN